MLLKCNSQKSRIREVALWKTVVLSIYKAADTTSMRKTIRHDKRTKNKKGKALKSDIAFHPFVMASIIAAIAVVVWVILFQWFRFGY